MVTGKASGLYTMDIERIGVDFRIFYEVVVAVIGEEEGERG